MSRDNVNNDWAERDEALVALAGQLHAERPASVTAPAGLRGSLRARLLGEYGQAAPRRRRWAFDVAATAMLVSLMVLGGVWLSGNRPADDATPTVAPTLGGVIMPSLTPTFAPTVAVIVPPSDTPAPTATSEPAGLPVIAPDNAAQVAALTELTAKGTETEGIGLIQFAWSPDGAWLALTHPGGVTLYTAGDYSEWRTFEMTHPMAVAFSPDSQRLAASNGEPLEIWVWDVATGDRAQTLSVADQQAPATQIAFSPDGTLLLGVHQVVTIWDLATGAARFSFDTPAVSAAFAPSGNEVAVGVWTQDVEIWDAVTGQRLGAVGKNDSEVAAVAYSPDGTMLASAGGADGYIKLWNPVNAAQLHLLSGHVWGTVSLAFSADGRVLASSGRDDKLRLWDTASGALLQTINAEAGVISPVAFSPRGDRLASGCMCSSHVRVWGVTEQPLVFASPTPFVTPESMVTPRMPAHTLITDLDWLPNGAGLLVSAYPTGVEVYDPATLQVTQHLADGAWQLTVDPTGQRVVGLSQAGAEVTVQVWDAQTWQVLYTLNDLPDLFPQDAAFSPDGQTLALSGQDVVELRDAATGTLRQSEPYTGWRVEVGFSANGTVLLAAGEWQVETRQWVTGNSGGGFEVREANTYTFSPNGAWLLTRHREGVKLWDMVTGLLKFERAMAGTDVSLAAFSPDGRLVLDGPYSAEGGWVVDVWEAATGTVLHRLQGAGEWRTAAFSPDGTRIALGNDQGQVQLWDVATGQMINTVTMP
jgi:WD40 repeat protein